MLDNYTIIIICIVLVVLMIAMAIYLFRCNSEADENYELEKLYKRYVAGDTIKELEKVYDQTFKNSKLEIGNLSSGDTNAKNNMKDYLKAVNNHIDVYVSFYAIGGKNLPESEIVDFYKRLVDAAIKSDVCITMSAPEDKFYDKNKRIQCIVCDYCVLKCYKSLFVTFQSYRIDCFGELKEFVCKYDNFFGVNLVQEKYVVADCEINGIITDEKINFDRYVSVAKKLFSLKTKTSYSTHNIELRNVLKTKYYNKNTTFKALYGVNNNLDELYKEYKQVIVMSLGNIKTCKVSLLMLNSFPSSK